MDNCAAHLTPYVINSLNHLDVIFQFSPAYSPEINPIEYYFGTLKVRIRQKGYTKRYHYFFIIYYLNYVLKLFYRADILNILFTLLREKSNTIYWCINKSINFMFKCLNFEDF